MLNRQSKTLIAATVCALFSGVAFAQQAGPAAGNPSMQMAQEPARPQNPLEEMSRLNAEIATLRAKLQVTDIKSQIKRKEEEMAPPKPAEKVVKKEPKQSLPPLPNLNSLPKLDLGVAKAATPSKVRGDPQVVAIEGVGDDLYAEIQSEWGGYAKVRVNDSYHEYQITELTPRYVKAKNGKGQTIQLAMRTAAIQRLQAAAAMPQPGQMNGQMGMGALPGPGQALTTPSGLPPYPVQTLDPNTLPPFMSGDGSASGPIGAGHSGGVMPPPSPMITTNPMPVPYQPSR